MEREELLRLFISLDFVTINPVVIIGYTIIILGDITMCRVVEQFRNEGLEQGRKQGRTDEQKRIAENMVTQGLEDALIITVTGITKERLDVIKSNVRKSE